MPPRKQAAKKVLQEYANDDTPNFVNIPPTWSGIASWLFGRFGIAVIFVYSSWMFYQDSKATNALMLDAYKENAAMIEKTKLEHKIQQEANAKLIESLTQAVEENTKAISALSRESKN